MIKRNLKKEVEIFTDESRTTSKLPIKLEYYLLESEMDETEELKGKKVFGIEVIKKMHGISDEVQSFRDLSCSIENAQNILNILAINTVTPVGLPYVLEDIIGL